MNNQQNAHFLIRFLAWLFDTLLFALSISLLILVIAKSSSLQDLASKTVYSLAEWVLPLGIISFLYLPLTTYFFHGSIGKILSGLRVKMNNLENPDLRTSFFRYLLGYTFSGTFFGLGFFAILKNENNLAWHDEAFQTRVIRVQQWWPLALACLILLLGLHYYLLHTAWISYQQGLLPHQFASLTP